MRERESFVSLRVPVSGCARRVHVIDDGLGITWVQSKLHRGRRSHSPGTGAPTPYP